MSRAPYRIALAGNPNCGKTTLFNALTGSAAYVGNWPGVTVERREALSKDGRFLITDLPGVYSLSPFSPEERAASAFLLDSPPDVILNILDGTCPERSLYLTQQLLEHGRPMVATINMADEMAAKGIQGNWAALGRLLGVPAVPISARKGRNLPLLLDVLWGVAEGKVPCSPLVRYDSAAMQALEECRFLLASSGAREASYYSAASLLEQADSAKSPVPQSELNAVRRRWTPDVECALASARYRRAEEISRQSFRFPPPRVTLSDRIDRIATGRFTALPLFALILTGIFFLTFGTPGRLLSARLAACFQWISEAVRRLLLTWNVSPWLADWVTEGALGGVFAVLSFFPQIALLFFCLSFLEDSGYMARAAFLADRPLRKLGLSGKSFIPLLMGFGCTAPAAMASRTIEEDKCRRMTVLLLPFLSCGAKMPVYLMLAGLFFPEHRALAVGGLYLGGVLLGVLTGAVLRHTLFRKAGAPFLMELPAYRLPSFHGICKNVWEKCRGFLTKTLTVILSMTLLIWFLQHFTASFRYTPDPSVGMLAQLGRMLAPLLEPLGFGRWETVVSLLTGFIAKENILSTLWLAFGGEAGLTAALSPASALSFLVFIQLYLPCIAAMTSIKNEIGFRAALLEGIAQTLLAWGCSFAVFRLARFLL